MCGVEVAEHAGRIRLMCLCVIVGAYLGCGHYARASLWRGHNSSFGGLGFQTGTENTERMLREM